MRAGLLQEPVGEFSDRLLDIIAQHPDAHTLERLLRALREDPNREVRLMAPAALVKLKDPKATPALEQASHTERDPAVLQNIGYALLALRGGQDTATLLRTLKEDPAPMVRAATVEQLARIKDPRVVPALIERIEKDSGS